MKQSKETEMQKISGFEGLFGVLFIVLAGLVFLNSGIFSIKEVIVHGNEDVSTEDILLAAQLDHYKNIFQIDVTKIKKEILRNPKIASVVISRHLPHEVLITIKERHPVCLLLYLDNLLLIGEDAVVMGVKDENEPISLPIVSGLRIKQARYGSMVKDSRFAMALEILKYADENLRQVISEINVIDFQLYLDLPNSHQTLKVDFGNSEQLEKKIYNLRAILSHTAPDELGKIDLRVPDLPTVIRLKKAK